MERSLKLGETVSKGQTDEIYVEDAINSRNSGLQRHRQEVGLDLTSDDEPQKKIEILSLLVELNNREPRLLILLPDFSRRGSEHPVEDL